MQDNKDDSTQDNGATGLPVSQPNTNFSPEELELIRKWREEIAQRIQSGNPNNFEGMPETPEYDLMHLVPVDPDNPPEDPVAKYLKDNNLREEDLTSSKSDDNR